MALAIRVATVVGRPHRAPGGDALYYWEAAKLLVAGHGFLNPFDYYDHGLHHQVATARWPPLFVAVLALPMLVGLKSFLVTRLWCCVLGTAAVVAGAYAGREVGGRRVGLVVAFLMAIYPNLWMSDELALSEALSPLLIALLLWLAYRFWRSPRPATAVALAAMLGVAMLARDELSLLVVVLLVPLALLARTIPWRRRFGLLGIGVLTTALVVAPWVGFNLSRFDEPVFISTGLGDTLASTNCATTYSGAEEGYWSYFCFARSPVDPRVDESVQETELEHDAEAYVDQHRDRLVPVLLARVGRGFGLFHPVQQVRFDAMVETRPLRWAMTGLVGYYALAVLALGGTVILRRRRIPSFPLWVIGLDAVVAMALTFGDTRYRTTFEVSLVILASVAIEALWTRTNRLQRARRRHPSSRDLTSRPFLPPPGGRGDRDPGGWGIERRRTPEGSPAPVTR